MDRQIERAGEELAGRNAKLRSLFEGNVLPLVLWDRSGAIHDANDAYLKLIRYSRRELVEGKIRWDHLTPLKYAERDERAIKELLSGKVACTPFKKEYICGDGRPVPVVLGGAFFPNRQDGGIAFALDLTKYSSAQDALLAEKETIHDVYAALLGVDRLGNIDSLISLTGDTSGSDAPAPGALLAHEISQPLGSILANAQSAQRLLRRRAPDLEELKAIVRDIISEDRRASHLIDQVRFSVLRNRRALELVNISILAGDVLRMLRRELERREIQNDFALAPELPLVRGDRSQLHQLLVNLLSNACEAVDQAGAPTRRVFIRTYSADGASVSIEVRDSGPGIPAPQLEAIFQPFVSNKSGGMGIGLYICRAIVRFHNGRVWATNNPGGGASFHVCLPAALDKSPIAASSDPKEG